MKDKLSVLAILCYLTISYISYAQESSTILSFRGKVTDTVYCKNDISQSYALYLPSFYSDSSSFPIIYFLEPLARGKLPVTLYKDVAESMGIILVGSNNSQNGSTQLSNEAFTALRKDTKEKFSIDPKRIFTSGFSGGGRMAQDIAFNDDDIAGVISVAGPKLYSNYDFSSSQKTRYVGLVGTKDMNYAEHILFEQELTAANIENTCFTYNLHHDWAPSASFKQAVEWHLVSLLKTNLDNTNTPINEYVVSEINRADQLVSTDPLKTLQVYRSILANFNSNHLVNLLLAKIKKLEKNHKREIKSYENQLKKECKHQKEYQFAYAEIIRVANDPNLELDSSQYNMKYWQNLIDGLKKKQVRDSSNHLYSRELDYLRGQHHNHMQNVRFLNLPELEYMLSAIGLVMYPNNEILLWNQYMLALVLKNRTYKRLAMKNIRGIDPERLMEVKKHKHFNIYRDQFPDLYQ